MIFAEFGAVVVVRYRTRTSKLLGYTKSHHHIFWRVIYYKCFIISPSKGTDPFVSPVSWLPQFGSCSFTPLLDTPILIPHEDLCHHLFPLFTPPPLVHPPSLSSFPPPPPGRFPVRSASGVALRPNLWSRCCVRCLLCKERSRNVLNLLLWRWHHPRSAHMFVLYLSPKPLLMSSECEWNELPLTFFFNSLHFVLFPGCSAPQSPLKTQLF